MFVCNVVFVTNKQTNKRSLTMARPKSYTKQDIVSAAQAINEEGKVVNGSNLRLKVGKGRPDTLFSDYEHLVKTGAIKEAEKQQEIAVIAQEIEQKPLPTEVADSLSLAIGSLEAMVRNCNDKAHAVNEQRVASEIKQARLKAEVAQTEAAESSKELDKALLSLGIAEDEQAELEDELAEMKSELKQLKACFDAKKSECDRLLLTNKTLETENTANAQKVTSLQVHLDLKLKQLNEAKSEFKADLNASSAAKALVLEKLAKLEQEHKHLIQKNESNSRKIDGLGKRDKAQIEMIQELNDTVSTLRAQNERIAALEKQNEELNRHITSLLAKKSEPKQK